MSPSGGLQSGVEDSEDPREPEGSPGCPPPWPTDAMLLVSNWLKMSQCRSCSDWGDQCFVLYLDGSWCHSWFVNRLSCSQLMLNDGIPIPQQRRETPRPRTKLPKLTTQLPVVPTNTHAVVSIVSLHRGNVPE